MAHTWVWWSLTLSQKDACCIDRGPKGNIYRVHETPQTLEYVKWLNYPWHIYSDYNTLNTPSQMQRECNVVAFGELTLSIGQTQCTTLWLHDTRYIQSPKMKDVVEACNSWTCRCRKWSPPQEGIAFTTVLQRIARVFTNQYVDSSTWTLLWRFWTKRPTRLVMCQNKPNGMKIKSQQQDGKAVILSWWWLWRPLGHDL